MKVLMDNFTNLGKIVNGKIIRAVACSGDIEMIKYFGQKIDDHQFESLLSDENDNGETIFHDIAKGGHLKVLKYLCQEKSRFTRNFLQKDHFQRTPIHWAAAKGHFEMVKFFAYYSPNPNAADKFGCTPSRIAKSEGFLEIEAYLLKMELHAKMLRIDHFKKMKF